MKYNKVSNKKHSVTTRRIVTVCGAVVLIAAILTVLEATNTTHFFHHRKTVLPETTADSATKGTPRATSTTGKNNTGNTTSPSSGQPGSSSYPGTSSKQSAPTYTAPLLPPSGDFVSSHHVSSGDTISSVCTTTPGATCTIIFSGNGTQKSLNATQTDQNGSVYWNWKPSDIGLTAGTWTITAKAQLGDQTQTASDALNLVVSN